MVKYVKVSKNGTITLPRETLKAFPAFTELVLWWKGDALVLKRVSPFLPSEFAERLPKKEMTLREIVKEIHRMRQEKKRG
jgi:bifunctional DNA-binding transcriptional regulator/antitoxin component of YhaV-PrlF toxin-antitoxin module